MRSLGTCDISSSPFVTATSPTSYPCEGAAVSEEVVGVQPGMVSSTCHEDGIVSASPHHVVLVPLSFDPSLLSDSVELHSLVGTEGTTRVYIDKSTWAKVITV